MAANGAEVKGEGVDGGVGVPGEGYLCPFVMISLQLICLLSMADKMNQQT